METKKEVKTNVTKLAISLIHNKRYFRDECLRFKIEVTPEVEMIYESGFKAALMVMGITPGDAVRTTDIYEELQEVIEESNDFAVALIVMGEEAKLVMELSPVACKVLQDLVEDGDYSDCDPEAK